MRRTLHVPDATHHIVHLVQSHDDAFWVTPEMQRLTDRASRPRLGAASNGMRRVSALAANGSRRIPTDGTGDTCYV